MPHPDTRTIEQLCADEAGRALYAHEMCTVRAGSARDVLHDAVTEAGKDSPEGWSLVGALHTALGLDTELLLIWSIASWAAWGRREADRRRRAPTSLVRGLRDAASATHDRRAAGAAAHRSAAGPFGPDQLGGLAGG